MDPTGSRLVYSSHLGGSHGDLGFGIAVDFGGHAYVLGETASPDFPTTPGAFDTACGADGRCDGSGDLFVAKVHAAGDSLVYSTYLGGSGEDRSGGSHGIAVDTDGGVYVTGLTLSADFPNTHDQQLNGAYDAVAARLNPQGTALIYAVYLGGPGSDSGHAIAVDLVHNAYITGTTGGTFPTTSEIYTCADPGAFVTKLLPDGSTAYALCLSGESIAEDRGHGIAVDPLGNAYVAGFTESPDFPLVNPVQPVHGGLSDAFVVKIADGLTSAVIERKYQEMGGPTGPLGAPVGPEYINPDGMGRRQQYEHGHIYWSPTSRAYAVLNGPFWEKWGALGWEEGPLGYPVTDEMVNPSGAGRRQYFQFGQLHQPDWDEQVDVILNISRSMTTCNYGDPDCSQCVTQIFDQVDALFNGNRDASVGFTMHLDERISWFGGEHVQGVAQLPDITLNGHRRGRVVMSFNEGKGLELGYQPVAMDREAFRYGSAQFDSAFSVGVRAQLNHPGGIQAHGDLLVVAMEQDGAPVPPAQIQFVRFSETSGEIVNTFSLDGSQGEPHQATQSRAASEGFLKLNSGFFLLAVSGASHGRQGIWFYESSDREINGWTTWHYVDFWEPPCVGYDGECFRGATGGLPLLAGCDGNVSLLGLTGEDRTPGQEYDTIQLYQVHQLDSGRVSFQKLVQHRRSVGRINLGKISFRWAGGAFVSMKGLLSVTATQRRASDFSGSPISATTFYPKCRPELPVACD